MDQDIYMKYFIELNGAQKILTYNTQTHEVENEEVHTIISQEKLDDMVSTLKVLVINAGRV